MSTYASPIRRRRSILTQPSQNLALWSSAFLVVNWAFGLGFVPRPLPLSDKIFLYGIAPAFSFAIPPMVIYDWPRDRNCIYQIVLVVAIWMWSVYQILFMWVSSLFSLNEFWCANAAVVICAGSTTLRVRGSHATTKIS